MRAALGLTEEHLGWLQVYPMCLALGTMRQLMRRG